MFFISWIRIQEGMRIHNPEKYLYKNYLKVSHLLWHLLPHQPGPQLHSPDTGSQEAEWRQGQEFSHRGPHVPGGQAAAESNNF